MPGLPTNKAAEAANSIIKGIEGAVSPMIEKIIIAQAPALGLPLVKQIVDEIEAVIENQITKYIETGADFLIIDLQAASENGELVAARAEYIRALRGGDQAAILRARENYDQAQSALAHDDGSASP